MRWSMDNLKQAVTLCCLLLVVNTAGLGAARKECKAKKCKHGGPEIRFPFRLKGQHPSYCGYPGFDISCGRKKKPELELPYGVKLLVDEINYEVQRITLLDPEGCLPRSLRSLNLSATPFQLNYGSNSNGVTLFNCSVAYNVPYHDIHDCLSFPGYQVRAFESPAYYSPDLLNCSKIKDIPNIPGNLFDPLESTYLDLNWSKPSCELCEQEGQICGPNSNGREDQIECFVIPIHHIGEWKKLMISGLVLGLVLLLSLAFGIYWMHQSHKNKKLSQSKIEKFLEDYRTLKPSRYSYADIKRITSQFKEKLGQGGYGTVFKGRISNDVLVAVKVLNNFKGNGDEFINEVGSMGRIHHVNITRLIGFCADGYHRALVYEFLPNESLEKFIFTKKGKKRSLSWEKLQDIALGIARGIEYLHQGCEQRILHFDIKPHNVLLDNNFNPKISDFGLAKLCSKDQSAVSMTAARGTMGYIAPEVLSRNFGNVSYKSDVYSFGMVLLEMVGGRTNIDVTVESSSQVYFPEWVYDHIDKGEKLGIKIEEEKHAKIAKKLAIVGLWCIQWCPVDRPSMKAVVQMLEGEANNLEMPPNPFASSNEVRGVNIPKRPVNRELGVIVELE